MEAAAQCNGFFCPDVHRPCVRVVRNDSILDLLCEWQCAPWCIYLPLLFHLRACAPHVLIGLFARENVPKPSIEFSSLLRVYFVASGSVMGSALVVIDIQRSVA